MTLIAKAVSRDDVNALIKLSVLKEQNDRVASNSKTLAQAAYETGSTVYGLWNGDKAVGLMAVINMREYPWPDEGDDLESLFLWRLMIDKSQQSKGYGTQALKLLVEKARELGMPTIISSVVQEDGAAMPFYEAFGFKQTGDVSDGEMVIRLKL